MAESETGNESVSERREWVEEVARDDYFFWERFFYRLRFPQEQPLPSEWYRPGELVAGAPGVPPRQRTRAERALAPETIRSVIRYAAPRRTELVYVLHQGEIEFAFFGEHAHPGSLLPIRSITKSIVGLLIGIAIADGAIDGVDARIGDYVDEWHEDPRGDVTLRQLLHMASGLETVPLEVTPENKALRLAEGSDVWAAALDYELVRPPDTELTINQADTQILGIILERATGKRLADYLSEKLWQPMGMGTATLNLDGMQGRARAFCCMRARGIDVLKLGKMVADGGLWNGYQVVPRQWIELMTQRSPASGAMGLHTFLGWNQGQPEPPAKYGQTEPYLAPDVIYFLGGFSVYLWMIPSQDLVIFRFGEDPPDWDPSVLPNLILKDLADQPPQ